MVSNHRSLLLVLVMLPAILCLAEPLRADAWEPVTPPGAVPGARAGHSMVLIGGQAYLFGGDGNAGETGGVAAKAVLVNDLWYLEQESDEWKQLNPNGALPKARKDHAAVAYGEKMFIFFGADAQGVPLGDIWAYDTVLKIWQEVNPKGELPVPKSNSSVAVAGDTAYMYGGKDRYNNVYSDLYSFDLKTFTWKREGDSDYASQGHWAGTSGTEMYVYGGDNGQLVYDHLLSYDYATKEWKKITPQSSIPAGRTNAIAALNADKITIEGGRGQTGERGDTWEYDIVSNQWVKKADGPVQSQAAAVGVPAGSSESMISASQAAGYILMFGGQRSGQFLDEMWKYSYGAPIAPKTTPAINLLLQDKNP